MSDGHFLGGALFDRDFCQAVARIPVYCCRGQRDIERDAIVERGERLEISANLVGNIAVAGCPVGARDYDVDLAVLHQVPAGVIDDQRVGHVVPREFPGGEL